MVVALNKLQVQTTPNEYDGIPVIDIEDATCKFSSNPKSFSFDLTAIKERKNEAEKQELKQEIVKAHEAVENIKKESAAKRQRRIQGAWNKRVDKNTATKLAADTAAAEKEVQELIEIL